MNVFELRNRLIEDYRAYVTSFVSIRDSRIQTQVKTELTGELLWPEPRIAINPAFAHAFTGSMPATRAIRSKFPVFC